MSTGLVLHLSTMISHFNQNIYLDNISITDMFIFFFQAHSCVENITATLVLLNEWSEE